jgi:Beta-galactosidase/beta-glucuronidase
MKKGLLLLIAIGMGLNLTHAQTRTQLTLEKGWKFTREDNPRSSEVGFDDGPWQSVRVPHDWAIYGPFSKDNDIHRMAIVQDGQTTAIEHYGRTGGLPFVGVGWYRNLFSIPGFSDNKRVIIQFDGAMSNAHVFVNGKEAGYWPNGYNTFYFDITGLLNGDGNNNTLAVRLENFEEQSRWYPGAGLYRNVHLITTHRIHIPVWGTYVTTPEVNDAFARVNVKTKVETAGTGSYKLITEIKDASSNLVASDEAELTAFDLGEFSQDLIVENPQLWDIQQPNLYTVVSKLYEEGRLVDEYITPFGIRTIEIVPDKGFLLNGRVVKFQGACLHHDMGPLGAAVNEAAIRRQIRIMQDMGVNAIRTSHNMPAPERTAREPMGMLPVSTSSICRRCTFLTENW